MKRYRKFSGLCAVVFAAVICGGAADVSAAIDPVTREVFEEPAAGIGQSGFEEVGGRLFRYEGGEVSAYSGIMAADGKKFFYEQGSKWFGWKKIDGKWYYFDPAAGGAMAGERAETALGVYYIEESGAWEGRYTAKAKAPGDFAFSYGSYGYGSWLSLDSVTGALSNGVSGTDSPEGTFDRSVKVTNKDKQIIYDTLFSCGGDKLSNPLTGEALIGGNQNTDQGRFEVRFTAGGKSYTISGDRGMYPLYGKNEQVTSCAYITAFLEDYIKTFPEWGETEAVKAAGGALSPAVTEISKFNGVQMRLYKYPASDKAFDMTGQSDIIISSREEAQAYAGVLESAYGEKCSAAAGVLSYDEGFFRDNVLYMNTVYAEKGEHKFKFTGAQRQTANGESEVVLLFEDTVSEGEEGAFYVFAAQMPRERIEGCKGVRMQIGARG